MAQRVMLPKHRPLGEKIRYARKTAGLSHDRLGAMVGTSRQHLIRLEQGLHRPRPEMLAKIAEATGQSEAFFQDDGGEDDEEESDPVTDLLHAIRRMVRDEVASVA